MSRLRSLAAIAWASARNRRFTLVATVVALALSVFLMLAVERLREQARESFMASVSGVDLVVGPRSSPLQLVLHAIFRLGSATHNMSWQSVEMLRARPEVAFVIPIALGDSHRNFPVVGTTPDYFTHFRHGDKRPLAFASGTAFAGTLDGLFEAVVGSEVAGSLGYSIGTVISLSHGSTANPGSEHDDRPFKVVGILAPTGTPVDRSVHVSLSAIEALHVDWVGGARMPGLVIPSEQLRRFDLKPKAVAAALVGLNQRAAVFAMQRSVNGYRDEALVAVLPGIALDELWSLMAVVEQVLRLVSALVFLVSVLGLLAILLASLNERRRELAILRSVGASPRDMFVLLGLEMLIIVALGCLFGLALLLLVSAAAAPLLADRWGVQLRPLSWSGAETWMLLGIALAGFLASLVPAWRAYRLSLADGLSPRS